MAEPRRKTPLHTKIFIGLILGAVLGGTLNLVFGGADDTRLSWFATQITEPVGQLFLRLLLLLVIPLVFSSLVVGVAGLGDLRRIGRIGVKSLAYTVVISAISVVIGLTIANVMRPGDRIDPVTAAALEREYGTQAQGTVEQASAIKGKSTDAPLTQVVKTIIPSNPFAAAANNPPDMIGIMFVALLFGILLTMIDAAKRAPILLFFEAIFEAVAKGIDIVMRLAPYAVFSLLFTMTARFGFGLLGSLGWYVGAVLLGLAIHMFGTYSLSVWFLSKISPLEFFRRIKTVMITAFSTSSSNATLPTAIRVSEENLGVPRDINNFVLTVGATANQNGTALFEGVTVLFLAQLAGVDLSIGQQLMVLYLAILGGIGTAGVPSGSIPFIVIVLTTIGINPALIAIILGVDRLLDMCRTTLNVVGDLTVATYVARSEGFELLHEQPRPAEVDL
ncbi:MAG TPA: dicarboxylate/amino acid:cation symporter [Thermoanaerobaculia bacterium]|nr:dicarboxylate/amino acid:cation symporter [Thermoanaerobaculia bacterium]